jgi:DNA-binding CsgD family transcriptional regulator
MARRIVNCCFGENDRQPDVDEFGAYHFEMVTCPRVAECKYYKVICSPRYESTLSPREMEVMEMYYRHVPTETIAERLYISIHTVNNHRRNALQRLRLHSIEEFIGYACRNGLYENKKVTI